MQCLKLFFSYQLQIYLEIKAGDLGRKEFYTNLCCIFSAALSDWLAILRLCVKWEICAGTRRVQTNTSYRKNTTPSRLSWPHLGLEEIPGACRQARGFVIDVRLSVSKREHADVWMRLRFLALDQQYFWFRPFLWGFFSVVGSSECGSSSLPKRSHSRFFFSWSSQRTQGFEFK